MDSPTRCIARPIIASLDNGSGLLTPPQTPRNADDKGSFRFDDSSAEPSAAPLHLDTAIEQYPHHQDIVGPALAHPDRVAGRPDPVKPTSFTMVIGGLGYIGSHTTLELLKEGLNVIVIDDLSNSYIDVLWRIRALALEHSHKTGRSESMLRFHNLDFKSHGMRLLLQRYTRSPFSITGVIHFAAYKSVSESIERPLAYYQNNISGLIELLIALQEVGINNFVFSSSATVYGEQANAGRALREDDLVHFDETISGPDGEMIKLVTGARGLTSPYGRTKYFAEAILADVALADPNMKITALRYFNPVGCHPSGILREDPRQQATNLFPVIASVMKGAKEQLEIFGSDWPTRDGTAIRDFIHVMDLAQGHVAALVAANANPNREPFRAYNLGSGTGMTVAEVVSSFEHASNLTVPVVRTTRRAGDVGYCVAETKRAHTELGWRTTRMVDECARDTWNALTRRGEGCYIDLEMGKC